MAQANQRNPRSTRQGELARAIADGRSALDAWMMSSGTVLTGTEFAAQRGGSAWTGERGFVRQESSSRAQAPAAMAL